MLHTRPGSVAHRSQFKILPTVRSGRLSEMRNRYSEGNYNYIYLFIQQISSINFDQRRYYL